MNGGFVGEPEPYYDTPPELVDVKLKLAELKPGQLLLDLGCGNGMVMVKAVQQYGVKAIGYELLDEALKDAEENIQSAGLSEDITLIKQDFREAEVEQADALVLYHGRNTLNMIFRAIENDLKSGAVIITHDFDIPGWKEVQHYQITLSTGAIHEVYRYLVP